MEISGNMRLSGLVRRGIVILFLLLQFCCLAQTHLLFWNIMNFGRSKDSSEMRYIARTVSGHDLIGIAEVSATGAGPEAVKNLVSLLRLEGKEWDFSISDETSSAGGGSERYAFIWRKDRIEQTAPAALERKFSTEMEREPYVGRFRSGKDKFTLVMFHAVPKSKQPEQEIKYLKYFPELYAGEKIVFIGDFNTPASNSVFNPLKKMGFISAMNGQKTSLRQKCINGDCLASEYDHILFRPAEFNVLRTGILHFYKDFPDMRAARTVSDHVPLYFHFFVK